MGLSRAARGAEAVPSTLRLCAVLAVPSAAAVLVVAGCGGGSAAPGIASVAGSPAGSTEPSGSSSPKVADAEQLSECMRRNGVPNFPDPSVGGGIDIGPGSGIDPRSASFQAAQITCQQLMPHHGGTPSPQQLAKIEQGALAFSACMRAEGLTDFPDPTFTGSGISLRLKAGPGSDLNPNAPRFLRAQQACRKKLPGEAGK